MIFSTAPSASALRQRSKVFSGVENSARAGGSWKEMLRIFSLGSLIGLAVGLDAVDAVVVVDDLAVELGLVDELDDLGARRPAREQAGTKHGRPRTATARSVCRMLMVVPGPSTARA